MLSDDDKMMHYRWLAGLIAKAGENSPSTNGTKIYKHTLKFTTKIWWLVFMHRIAPTTNGNTLGVTNYYLVAAFVLGVELNILQIIMEEIRDRVLQFITTLPFFCLVTQLIRSA
ncbi:hypothetical protein FXO38_33498 [Capsicum annuum]|nr:hypothetical protein FXO38_33498 [Capsicum annuum]